MAAVGVGGLVQVTIPVVVTGRQAAALDFGKLLVAEQTDLLRLAHRLVWEPEEARDLVQATFVYAFERRGQLRDAAAIRGWLRRILVHRAMTLMRRRRAWSWISGLFTAHEEHESPSPERALESTRARERLAKGLRALPVRQATAFSLRYLTRLSLDDVAETMAIGRGTVRVHIYRALCKLRQTGALSEEEQP
jgi:RNA polymerase sigma-70 factor (ECF subfamily)